MSPNERAATLLEALPYIQRFAGKVVVVKYGGNALAGSDEEQALSTANEGPEKSNRNETRLATE